MKYLLTPGIVICTYGVAPGKYNGTIHFDRERKRSHTLSVWTEVNMFRAMFSDELAESHNLRLHIYRHRTTSWSDTDPLVYLTKIRQHGCVHVQLSSLQFHWTLVAAQTNCDSFLLAGPSEIKAFQINVYRNFVLHVWLRFSTVHLLTSRRKRNFDWPTLGDQLAIQLCTSSCPEADHWNVEPVTITGRSNTLSGNFKHIL